MKRLMSLLAISLISTNVGCALCSSCDDYSYGAFGGLWERTDMVNGRVGSAFSPAGYSTQQLEAEQTDGPESNGPQGSQSETYDSQQEVPTPATDVDDDPSLET